MKDVIFARIVLYNKQNVIIEVIDDFFTSSNLKYIQDEIDYNTLFSSFHFYEKECAAFEIIDTSTDKIVYKKVGKSMLPIIQRFKFIIRRKFMEYFNIPDVKYDKYNLTYLSMKDSSEVTYRCHCKEIPELDAVEGYKSRDMAFTAMKKSVLNYLINIGLREVRNK